MNNRFHINKLIVEGIDCPQASLDFDPEINIIIGPSNTGKSYVYQCLNYLLGSTTPPKRIKESQNYTVAFLEIIDSNDIPLTIKRSLDGGDAHLFECGFENIPNCTDDPEHLIVGRKATKEHRTLSDFYMGLSDLSGKRVRKNKSGETHAVGFALIRRLTLIDEAEIIKEGSPILSGERNDITKEKCFFKFLMTGRDDSELIAKPKPQVVYNRKGQLAIIDRLIQEQEQELSTLNGLYVDVEEVDEQINKLGQAIGTISKNLQGLYSNAKELETTVNEYWKAWKNNESRLITVDELLSRFDLLSEHYESDKSRLESINETSKAFSQLEKSNCPICGREFDDSGHIFCGEDDIEEIEKATNSEIFKIDKLENNLNQTKSDLYEEQENLKLKIKKNRFDHLEAQKEATEYTSEKIQSTVNKLEFHKLKLREVSQAKKILERANALELEREELQNEIDPGDGDYDFDELSTSITVEFCKYVKNLLNDWGYSTVENVTFSEGTSDIVINGSDRNLSGKGYRALAYSAFVIGLMHYCEIENKSHSGVVVLDSPLCTLRSQNIEHDEAISDEVKNAFYRNLVTYDGRGQVIILDNDGPEIETAKRANYIEFSKDRGYGRYGFFRQA